jgi:dipeptidyl aminopeptidase/acylaminoacyl peptidase
VTRTLSLGSDQNLVYVYKDPSSTWHLRRYDARTGQKTDIFTTAAGQIEDAQVSADGQWVLFLVDFHAAKRTEASAKIQMVRIDGQGLQTLYCFPTNEVYSHFGGGSGAGEPLPIDLQLSPDQKSLLFSVDANNQDSSVYDLNMVSGKVQKVYQDISNTLYTTSIVTWLDNSEAYLITQGRTQPAPAATIRLLNVPLASANAGNAIRQVFQGGGHMHELSLDTSFDSATLYTDDCLLAGSPYQTTIIAGPSHGGGVPQTIYQPPTSICVDETRVISSTAILMLITDRNANTGIIQHEVWTMSVNGTAQHSLTTLTPNNSLFQFNPDTQYVWSNVSRDGSMYALQQETNNSTENLVYGLVNGGNVTTLATSSTGTLTLVGWTTM